MKKFISPILFFYLLFPVVAGTITVDDDGAADYSTIQAAIDNAVVGDVIVVEDGTYEGQGNVNLDTKGLAVTIQSKNGPDNCTIDGGKQNRAFTLTSSESRETIIEGFTLINCEAPNGAAIICNPASATITNCIIRDCHAGTSGGL